jgi:hypothetical protein
MTRKLDYQVFNSSQAAESAVLSADTCGRESGGPILHMWPAPLRMAAWLALAQKAVRSSSFGVMKKLLFLGACLAALGSSPVMAQAGPDLVIVRVEERLSGRVAINVARAGQAPEVIEFRETRKESAAKGYYPVLNKLYQQGYQL